MSARLLWRGRYEQRRIRGNSCDVPGGKLGGAFGSCLPKAEYREDSCRVVAGLHQGDHRVAGVFPEIVESQALVAARFS